MAVSVSVVTNSVPGFEFLITGPGLLTRAACDPAFEVRRKTDVFQGGCYNILIWFSVRFFRAIKDASETLWPSGKVETRFLWPPEPQGPTAGYTAPNLGFVETRIIGLTSEPLILRSGVAQTYSAGHHNFSETFLFEPALDPGVSAAQRAELDAAGIRQLVVEKGFFEGSLFWVVGLEGKLRKF